MSEKHGLAGSPEYRIWAGIKQRCCNPKRKDFPRYGGAGILLCDEWAKSFPAFLEYLGPRPSVSHSVDRIDGAKGYEPGNVRWATPVEQASNQSHTRHITHCGKTLSSSEWARETGIGFTTIIARLNRGLSADQVLSRGKLVGEGSPPIMIEFEGKNQPASVWAKSIGVSTRTLKKRLKAGIPLDRALRNPMPPT